MKVSILCVGKLGAAAEARLARDWATRASQTGRAHGLGPVDIIEIDGRRGGEGEAILQRAAGAVLVACDEHGRVMGSRAFATWLGQMRDDGVPRLVFAIGGADGLDPAVLGAARHTLAFGPRTWPHALARAMLAEQIYRAATLMAGQPYHRD